MGDCEGCGTPSVGAGYASAVTDCCRQQLVSIIAETVTCEPPGPILREMVDATSTTFCPLDIQIPSCTGGVFLELADWVWLGHNENCPDAPTRSRAPRRSLLALQYGRRGSHSFAGGASAIGEDRCPHEVCMHCHIESANA